jgi:lactate dehydrogenase-like 2-hydroxyacid dehydrogenase
MKVAILDDYQNGQGTWDCGGRRRDRLIASARVRSAKSSEGRVLGVLGLGNIGGQVARIGLAFGMKVIACRHRATVASERECLNPHWFLTLADAKERWTIGVDTTMKSARTGRSAKSSRIRC